MSDKSLTADRRERSARFARDAVQARTEYDADSKAVDELTARLRQQRLTREAADAEAAGSTKARRRRPRQSRAEPDAEVEVVLDMSTPYLFCVDERVVIAVKGAGTIGATGVYRVVRQLPAEGGDNRYRIKGETEAYERVVAESRLKKAG